MITKKEIERLENVLIEIGRAADWLEFDELEKRQASKLNKTYKLVKEVITNLKTKV